MDHDEARSDGCSALLVRLDFVVEGSVGRGMTFMPRHPAHPTPSFGRRLVPPLSAEQRAQAEALRREQQALAQQARFEAYQEAARIEAAEKFQATMRQARAAVARGQALGLAGGIAQTAVGFMIGWRLGGR